MSVKHREETVNTQLAILISKMGVTAEAETILKGGDHLPDVMFSLRGLRVVIEGKFADHPNAEGVVLGDAKRRVQSGVAHIAAAAVYPTKLRTTSTSDLESELSKATLRFMLVSELGQSNEWNEGTPDVLMAALRRAQEMMAQDDVVQETAEKLSQSLEKIAILWRDHKGACDRLGRVLGMTKITGETGPEADDRRETAAKVSALVLANAFIFQEMLSQTDERVETLRKAEKNEDLLGASAKHWRWIWENINYVPIFQLAERVLVTQQSWV